MTTINRRTGAFALAPTAMRKGYAWLGRPRRRRALTLRLAPVIDGTVQLTADGPILVLAIDKRWGGTPAWHNACRAMSISPPNCGR